jgi:hypothetical protein
MATNLDLQTQINSLLADQNKLLEQSAKLAKDQASLTRDMVESLRSANFKEVATDIQGASSAVTEASSAIKTLGATNQDVFSKMNLALQEAAKKEDENGKGIDALTQKMKRFSVAAAAIDGFVQGLRFTGNMLSTVSSAAVGLVSSLGNLAASILAIPFKMLTGLITMASSGGGDNGLRQALEDIRKEFGTLRETSGRAIVDMAKGMKGELAQTGLSTYRIFGNLAEKLKTMQEYAHNLGPLFAVLAGQFVKNTEAIGAYYKGLGLTEEGQKAVAARSFALGTALTEELRQITNYSHQLSKAFNGAAGSAKEISRDMATLMADFKHFGGISTKEIAQSVVYFRRLGIEISKVMGVIDKYDNFEDAATGAAQLSQAFNLNVDALEMMKAQNPAQRVEMLRKSFFAAGRSVENMTRQERALLAQQSGLDDSALDLAFSMKNQGMSYDQVTKKGDAAQKKQMTQVEAMKALSDSIERLVKSGSSGSGGFIDRFIQGFGVGIQRSRDFRHLMRELRVDLRVAYFEGIKVGRAFEEMFPGVRDVFQGIADMFQPARFRAMFKSVGDTFKKFFYDMTKNPQTALPMLLENLKKNFFTWFQGNSQNGRRVLDGFKSFFVALSHIAGSLLKIAMTGVREGVKQITDLITGKTHLNLSGANGAKGFLGQLLGPIIDAAKEVGPSLWGAIKTLFGELRQRVEPWARAHFLDMLGILFGPAAIGVVARTFVATLGNIFTQGLAAFVTGGGVTKAFNAVKNAFTGKIEDLTQHASRMPPPIPAAARRGGGAAGAIKGAEEAAQAATGAKVNWGAALVKMIAITAFIVIGMAGILAAIFVFAKKVQEDRITPQSIATASLAMVATAGTLVTVAGAVKLLSTINLNPGMLKSIVGGLLIVGGVSLAMAYGAKKMIEYFGDVEAGKLAKTALVMGAASGFFLAAGAVAAVAAGLGAIAVLGGPAGAAIIIAGLATLALVVEGMSVQGIRIMSAINDFRPSPGFAEKANVFVNILRGISSFTMAFAQLTTATRPGLMTFLNVGGEQRQTMDAVNVMINNVAGQLVRIVGSVRDAIDSLSGSEAQLRGAQALGSILSGVADLGRALQPAAESMRESGWYTTLTGGGESIADKVSATTGYIQAIAPELRKFVGMIGGLFTGQGAFARGITPEQERAATVIPGILKGVADFANSLRAGSSTIMQLSSGGNQTAVLGAVGAYMSSLITSLTESRLFDRINDVIVTIIAGIGRLNPAQVKAVEAFAPIIGPVFNTISQIGTVIGSLAVPSRGPAASNAGAIYQLTNLVSTFFTRIREDLPALITSMRTAFAGIGSGEASRLSKGMQGLSSLLGTVATFPTLSKSLNDAGGVGGMTESFITISQIMNDFASQLNPSNTSGIAKAAGELVPLVNNLTENIQHTHYQRLGAVVTGMVHEVNQLATTIRGLQPINIETELHRLGDSLGLGAHGEYTIQNRNFNININFAVKFDNNGLDAFELALLRRVGPGNGTRINGFDAV